MSSPSRCWASAWAQAAGFMQARSKARRRSHPFPRHFDALGALMETLIDFGAMGVRDYLGHGFVTRRGVPLIRPARLPVQPDAITETLQRIALEIEGVRHSEPSWTTRAAHSGCSSRPHTGPGGCRGYAEQGRFAETCSPTTGTCLAKLGCAGPVAKCNVLARGWVNGVGGCPNVGGTCMACTMPGFPDHFLPFMDSGPFMRWSTSGSRFLYGPVLRRLQGAQHAQAGAVGAQDA